MFRIIMIRTDLLKHTHSLCEKVIIVFGPFLGWDVWLFQWPRLLVRNVFAFFLTRTFLGLDIWIFQRPWLMVQNPSSAWLFHLDPDILWMGCLNFPMASAHGTKYIISFSILTRIFLEWLFKLNWFVVLRCLLKLQIPFFGPHTFFLLFTLLQNRTRKKEAGGGTLPNSPYHPLLHSTHDVLARVWHTLVLAC